MRNFKDWKEIQEWAIENGFSHLATRLQINNDYWMSSGEFGRSQVSICDSIRFCQSEEERLDVGKELDKMLAEDELVIMSEKKAEVK